ncbi:MAG: MFS transporter [Spirochaetales bacterium]|nr:MFS transporter [Spirochaetales bacterium]
MKASINKRISFLFFGQFVIAGSIVPILTLYLKDYLLFSGSQIGIIMAGSAVTVIIGPVLNTVVAERWVSSERLYAICQMLGGIFMAILAFQTGFFPFLILYLLFYTQFGPSNSLLNAVAFHHSPSNQGKFSGMRVWGTVGWILVAFLFSFWLGRGGELRDALFLCAGMGILLGMFSFLFIPGSKIRASERKSLFPKEVLAVFLQKDVFFICILAFLFAFSEKIYYFGLGIFIRELGVAEKAVMPVGSIAQFIEIPAMILFTPIFLRLKTRRTLILGATLLTLKYSLFTIGGSLAAVIPGLILHGPAFTFFMITCFIYMDEHCDAASRTGVHQLFMILEAGFANLLGNLTAGFLMERVTGGDGTIFSGPSGLFPQ